jgi:Helicase associated domain
MSVCRWLQVQADNDARWKRRFSELQEYKSIHGHCNVPQSTDLGKWVKMQRENKHEADLKMQGSTPARKKPKPCLSQSRIEKLEQIGFQWRVAKPAVGWENRYEQLVQYRNQHGDCNVPQSYPPDKPFGRWVMKVWLYAQIFVSRMSCTFLTALFLHRYSNAASTL